MAIDTTKLVLWHHTAAAGVAPERGICQMEEGVKTSERSRADSAGYGLTGASDYVSFKPNMVPLGGVIKAGTYEISFVLNQATGGAVRAYLYYNSGAGSVAGSLFNTACTNVLQTGVIVVAADITSVTQWEFRVVHQSLTLSTVYPVKAADTTFTGARAGGGTPRSAPAWTVINPQGSHSIPLATTEPYPFAGVGCTNLYPDDTIELERYPDSDYRVAHALGSVDGVNAMGAVASISTLGSTSYRTLSTLTPTHYPYSPGNTFYQLKLKDSAGTVLSTTVAAHCMLAVDRPAITTLNGSSAAPKVTSEATPRLSWANTALDLADYYQVRVYRASDNGLEYNSGAVSADDTTCLLPSTLPSASSLYAVVTIGAAGKWSVDSVRGYFWLDRDGSGLKITSHAGTLEAPEVITTQAPTFAWVFARTQAAYSVLVVDLADQSLTYESGWTVTATSSCALPAATLALGHTYAVQVQVRDAQDYVYGGDRVVLHVNEATVGAPTLTAEPDATTTDAVTVVWAAPSVGDGDTLTYELELTPPGGAATVYAVGAVLSWYLGRLSAGTYSWRVRATDPHGLASAWSSPDAFAIAQAGALPVVTLASWGPAASSAFVSTWTYEDADGDAQDAYQVQLATDAGFTVIVEDSGTVASTESFYRHTTTTAGAYYRRVRVRTNGTDWSTWDGDTVSVLAPTTQANTLELWRAGGAVAVDLNAHPASGVSITRRLDGPTAFSFTVDNFDGTRAGILADDCLELWLRDTDGKRLRFRGDVQTLGVGRFVKVECADPSAQWDRWRVTRQLQSSTLGQVITAIVENPTGDAPSGIVAQVEEIDDPITPGQPVRLDFFNGAGKSLRAWLADFQSFTGARWYLEWTGAVWTFRWFLPASRPDWSVTLRDDIDADAETSTAGTFGGTSTGATTRTLGNGYHNVGKYPLAERALVTRLDARADGLGNTGAQAIKGVIYSDLAGAPDRLIATTAEASVAKNAPAAWVGLTFAEPVLLEAGTYHLGVVAGTTANNIHLWATYGAAGDGHELAGSFASPSASWVGGASQSYRYCIYATYSAASRVLSDPEPTVTHDRRDYVNRVRYRMSYSPPTPPPGYTTFDAFFTEGAAGWVANSSPAGLSVADETTIKAAGAKSTRLRLYSTTSRTVPTNPVMMGHFLLPQQYRDQRGPDFSEIQVKARVDVYRDGVLYPLTVPVGPTPSTWAPSTYYQKGQTVVPTTPNGHTYHCSTGGTSGTVEPTWSTTAGATFWESGAARPSWTELTRRSLGAQLVMGLHFDGRRDVVWTRASSTDYYVATPLIDGAFGVSRFPLPKRRHPWADYLDNVTAVSFGVMFYGSDLFTAATSLEVLLYLDDWAFVPLANLAEYTAEEVVETNAVAAGTEYPVELEISDQALPRPFGALLANTLLANRSKTRTTVAGVALAGMRAVPVELGIPLALTTAGLIGTSYPPVEVTWAPLDSGDRTEITLGDAPRDERRVLEALANRIRTLDAQNKT